MLVAGGSGGIGAACARAFAAEGARVVVHYNRGEERARALADEIGAAGVAQADLTREPDVERLWDAVATTMRLDEDDPVEAWQIHAANLQARSDALNEHGFDAIRFRGPGTDLVVGLLDASRWGCATFTTQSGITHIPNLPTEEVFTTPDRRRAEGVVRSTYPLIVTGISALVEGLELTFEGGRIVDVKADGNGADIIRTQLAHDDGASRRVPRSRSRYLSSPLVRARRVRRTRRAHDAGRRSHSVR